MRNVVYHPSATANLGLILKEQLLFFSLQALPVLFQGRFNSSVWTSDNKYGV